MTLYLLDRLNSMKRSFIYCLLICIIGWWGIKALFGGVFYTSHDGYTHTARIAQYVIALRDRQFPPRWAGTFNGGLGSPIFVFSYPLPYFVGSLLYNSGFSLTTAFKIMIGGGFLLSGIGMFLFLRELFDERASFIGSLFYLFAPYRFLNIYVRGSLSESIAFVFIPFVFWGILKLYKGANSYWVIVTTFMLTFLLLSQNLVAAMFLPIIISTILLLWVLKPTRLFLLQGLLIVIGAFGIASFSYFPVFFERKYLRFAELINYFKDHFVAWWQLIRSPWGYGFSLPGTAHDEMSFQIGLAHLIVIFGALVIFIYFLSKKQTILKKYLLQTLFFCGAIVFLIIATILSLDFPVVKTLWSIIPYLKTVDLPWRFLGIVVFTSSICAAWFVSYIRSKIILIGLITVLLYANRNHIRVNQYLNYDDNEFFHYQGSGTWLNEYTPIERNTTKFHGYTSRYAFIDGQPQITDMISNSKNLTLQVVASDSSQIRLNILYFPGWHISLDGRELVRGSEFSVNQGRALRDDEVDDSGLILVKIPPGTHIVTAIFSETPLRTHGNMITVFSLLTLPVIAILVRKKYT